ncbi:glutamine-hydrolyzing carbamoyl-phosphate synthase small subunit [Autumnicola edwardsiae]|uniref:Carbamoyl phosphate synthase small chain n=1 Tax=Autumnicola edwardsiae TaxID=3075594 RepID=A0ABU3CW83_9FLAO|nr:glutamine-hydrolyzing carbamoyl-phosphate synthase small subunit [Zunongwangia sp. F297]MDT0650488.1 glutamine-hydrolyzing carbamoyl-phosphate synthase small subunit [Zunongwangia sp. F297]
MKYQTKKKAIVLLADGTVFHGKLVGDKGGTAFGEVCFNTGMTGYQEIFTDPSYFGQIMVTTNAHIGNYGTRENEEEADTAQISGLICKNFSYYHSRPAADMSLENFLKKSNLFAISDVDTRALVTYIRKNGAMNAIISSDVDNIEGLKKQLADVPDMNGLELASKVSTREPYFFGSKDAEYKVAVLDVGVKRSILKHLANRDVYCKVFPYNTSYNEMKEWEPDGYLLSNGPGDPQPLENAIQVAKEIMAEDKPLMGICLGHQIIALANGIGTYKMHHGHRGINHPILNQQTGKGEMTSQNHGFSVNKEEAENHPDVEVTHTHLNDHTVAGLKMKNKNCFSVQYHPEASPGPNDAHYLFDEFLERLKPVKV